MAKKEKSTTKEVQTPIEGTLNKSQDSIPEKKEIVEQEIKVIDLFRAIENAYGENGTDKAKKDCNKIVQDYFKQIVNEYAICEKYNVLILNDNTSIIRGDADKIYNAVTRFNDTSKPILLILYSRGGSPGSAYLIGKLCLEYSNNKLIVAIPRFAKSAATLLCCGATEIHMGSLSELGPIDPQIDDMPVLGLKNAIEHISEMVKANPESSDMFAKYLHLSMPLINLGYYERVAESAKQYAEKLLTTHQENLPKDAKDMAYDLVYKYKDHGFVIDRKEAETIFGDIIKTNTDEYEVGNKIYKAVDLIRTVAGLFNYNFFFIGSVDSEPNFTPQKTN